MIAVGQGFGEEAIRLVASCRQLGVGVRVGIGAYRLGTCPSSAGE
jgi:hypothetical protein